MDRSQESKFPIKKDRKAFLKESFAVFSPFPRDQVENSV